MMQGCRISHLDRPYSTWPAAVTSVPADAMRLDSHGRLKVGGPANFVVFRGRKYSELMSRPQYDRVCPFPVGGIAYDRRPSKHLPSSPV